ncbi:hypothetical protein DL766_002422 [Monosporascus sp. MC13-8B]|uniref:Aminoglycoside phosphotransferase domain-containing protein n=1 Tax=Monosporascus cannonballus TaxID=155416 RepID=A0ABY0H5R1_9PEZI|nr:hypothetical protein DL762_006323 [Monosporascus cannonballus]RYO90712.1 hypothetical protein DL763_005251 [Monosporascus cannonballus]RYP35565.1 hypothetical protein DL766_002422 [Monosporascus sp. MC13-8B]
MPPSRELPVSRWQWTQRANHLPHGHQLQLPNHYRHFPNYYLLRVPNHRINPYETEREFNELLLGTASSHSFRSPEEFDSTVATAKRMQDMPHPIVFTHGDFAMHNVLVHDGRVSGFIDWESAGWYPDYWESTTSLRWAGNPEWRSLLLRLGGSKYESELECELAIRDLTVYAWVM